MTLNAKTIATLDMIKRNGVSDHDLDQIADGYTRSHTIHAFFKRYRGNVPDPRFRYVFHTDYLLCRKFWPLFKYDLSNLNVRTIRDACVKEQFEWCEYSCKGDWDLIFSVDDQLEHFPNGYSISNEVAGFLFCFESEEDATLFKMFHSE